MAGNSLGRAVVEFGASTVTLQADAQRAVGIVDKAVADINVSLNRAGSAANFSGISSKVQGLKDDFAALQGVIASTFGVTLGVGALRAVANYADGWQNANNRILTTVDSASRLSSLQREIFAIAQDTGASYDESAKMYQRLEQSIEASGKSRVEAQQQALALTKTLNQEIVVSGASAGDASRSIMDLVHGLSGGVLHAQQLRPIMRQMPDLARQIAEGLGLSAVQFEEMAHKGLPAEAVLRSLAQQSDKIEQRFTTLPGTFARAWQQLENSVSKYVGEASQASAVSDLMKSSIVGIADNIGTVATGIELAGAAMGAWLGSKTLNALAGMATGLKDVVLAQGAYTTAAITSAEADMAAAAASASAVAATREKLAASIALREAELAELTAKEQALKSELALAEARARSGVYSKNVLADEARLEAARAELAAVTQRLVAIENTQDAALMRLTAAEKAETLATNELTAAKQRLAVAQAEATSATGLLSRAGSGLLALMGGWPGVIIAAAAAMVYFASKTDAASEEIEKLHKQAEELEAKNASFTQSLFALANGIDVTTMSTRDKLRADVAMIESLIKNATWVDRVTGSLKDYEFALSVARKQIEDLDKAQAAVDFQKFVAKAQSAAQSIRDMFYGNREKFNAELAAKNEELTKRIEKETQAEAKRVATFGMGRAATVEWERAQDLAATTAGLTGKALEDQTRLVYELYDKKIALAQAEDADLAAKKANTEATKEQAKATRDAAKEVRRLADDQIAAQQFLERLNGKLSGPYTKAWSDYSGAILEANKMAEKFRADGMALAQVQQFIADATEAATDRLREQTNADSIISRIVAEANGELQERVQLLGLSADEIKVNELYTRMLASANAELTMVMGPLTEEQQRQLDSLRGIAERTVEAEKASASFTDEQKRAQQVAQDYANIWVQAGNSLADTFAKVLVNGGSLFGSLVDLAKQTVQQIIAYFAKLAVINPILNAVFGGTFGGGGMMPTLWNAGAAMITGGQGTSGADFTVGGGGANSFSIMSPSSWISAGKSLWQGFQSGSMAPGSSIYGTWSGNGSLFGAGVDPAYTGGTYTPSGFGYAAAGVAGVYAGYNRWQGSNKDLGGAVGGVAYGVGTYSAAIGAGAALTGGMAAGLAAIPVVGWIALAAMAVDMLTGGKLFGTAGKLHHSNVELGIGDGGFDLSQSYTLKGQKAFFGGTKWTTKEVAPSAEALAAAQEFYDAILKNRDAFAKEFNAEVGELIGGVWRAEYDKKGNVKSQSATVMGHEYKDADQEAFAKVLIAENMIAVLTTFDEKLSSFAEAFRGDVDRLMDFAGAAATAQAYLQDGGEMLALATDQSISSLLALAEGAQRMDESLQATVQRLITAQQQYDQFVAQFKPATTYVDDFEAALSQLRDEELANIKTANELARAAGAEGAAAEDLANIHAATGAKIAKMVEQLEQQMQGLAFNLGLTSIGSLDQINAEIARLEGIANDGADAFRNVGAAITEASNRAKEAMDLLLGDLSPLNDEEKLQRALQGLSAGTATKEQVLEIGRRLYASGQQYNQLFEYVSRFSTPVTREADGGSTVGPEGRNLTPAEQERLEELRRQREELQATAQLQQYQTLAQQVAEITAFNGMDWREYLESRDIDIAAFEAGLGISDDQMDEYIRGLQEQKDSAGENTRSIVEAIHWLGDTLTGVSHTKPMRIDGPTSGEDAGGRGDGGSGRPEIVGGGRGAPGGDGTADAVNELTGELRRIFLRPGQGSAPIRTREVLP
jgi:tape measure domain-containing protein